MKTLSQEISEKLSGVMEPTYITFDHKDIDDFIARGNDAESAMIVSSFPEIAEWHHVKTKHGFIPVMYSPYIPDKTIIITRKPKGGYTL